MGEQITPGREGSLEAPTRHPLDWKSEDFWNEESLFKELERVYDICHGCRRCVSLCNSFPVLFDLVDESPTMELDGVPKERFWDVVDHCYLCDMCYLSKCPYVPPHPWNLDFPHLMLRAKAVQFRKGKTRFRDKLLTSTDLVGLLAGIPVVSEVVNAANRSKAGRALLDKTLGVHPDAPLPEYHSNSFHKREKRRAKPVLETVPTEETTGKVVVFATCYGNRNLPSMDEDLVAVLNHNGIPVTTLASEKCCGMPKLELGDLESVEKLKNHNIPQLAKLVDEGWDIVVPVPSCALMFKQELPLIFPDDEQVKKVQARTFDPFEYLMLRHKAGKLRTDFRNSLGKVSYHVPCHLRVQRIGLKTRDALKLVPDTTIEVIERCSGHNGTYAVKREYHETSAKIGRPVVQRVEGAKADHYSSDCPMAGDQIAHGLGDKGKGPEHPLTLFRQAYGI
jgi:glycerol-3-phosphate dehydrogenase subunit C